LAWQKTEFSAGLLGGATKSSTRAKMKILRPAILALLVSLAGQASAQTSNWTIDSKHSTAQFTVRHMGISNVSGSFTQVSGSAVINDKDITQSQVNAVIDVNSVDTRVPDRDKDLRSPNFFDAEKYPTIEFKSKRIVNSNGKLQMIGDLTMHGTTHEVTLDLEAPTAELTDNSGNQRRGFSASTTINRKDYGVIWSHSLKSGEAVVSDNVKIQIDVELVKKKG
jgi:polyisoprenoid-binding protein YceI